MEREISKVSPSEAGHVGSLYGSPYYLLHEGQPLALQWRDEWASIASPEAKAYCGFDVENWVGGTSG